MAKKKDKKKKIKKIIDIEQILLRSRNLYLFEAIREENSKELIKSMMALDRINTKPIKLWINSPGGSVDCGFAIIDTMANISSPVITIISGEACSMAGFISVAGANRFITKNSTWMGHDMSGGIWGDYTTKVLDRAGFLKKTQKHLQEFLTEHTTLSKADLRKATHGELWLDPYECLKKGIVDGVLATRKGRRIK